MTEKGWSDPPFRKLPLGAPGIEVAYRGPSTVYERYPDYEFSVTINGITYTDRATAPAEAEAIWLRHLEELQ